MAHLESLLGWAGMTVVGHAMEGLGGNDAVVRREPSEEACRKESIGVGREGTDMTTPSTLNILTFDWHEPYLCMLARTGHHLFVVEVEKGGVFGWQTFMRPVPRNVTLLKEADALGRCRRSAFDLVVCHNVRDLTTVQGTKIPKIIVFHNKISTEIVLGRDRIDVEQYRSMIRGFLVGEDLSLVFISEAKQKDCDLPGTVIPPGIDVDDYGGYTGGLGRVLRVGNLMKERDVMMGFSRQQEILGDIPSTLLGVNPTIPESKVSKSWGDLKRHFQSHRLFLNTTLPPWEDGYNLAMLEAMATGMPVVSVMNQSSPIADGVNGYVSDDNTYLRERIQELLANRERAVELGTKGRETVAKTFPMSRFVNAWNKVFEKAVYGSVESVTPRNSMRQRPDDSTAYLRVAPPSHLRSSKPGI